ncbi:MAG: SIS domain-containing protein [Methylococcaceae bacterium]|nr:SIS domain-containing protein [Methylococcaceae bacterium]
MKSFLSVLAQHQAVLEQVATINADIEVAGALLIETIRQGGKILLCGNGGSAADCQHIAAEFVVCYEQKLQKEQPAQKRKALAAIALTTDTSILTASANDIGYNWVFSRQVEALGNSKDCLIAISTSGNSPSVVEAVKTATNKGLKVIGMTGSANSEISRLASLTIKVPSTVTARIQEAHIVIGHWWCSLVEDTFNGEADNVSDIT